MDRKANRQGDTKKSYDKEKNEKKRDTCEMHRNEIFVIEVQEEIEEEYVAKKIGGLLSLLLPL